MDNQPTKDSPQGPSPERDQQFLHHCLTKSEALATLSPQQRLNLLRNLSDNPWFGHFILSLVKHQQDALNFILIEPNGIGEIVKREQAIGEISGIKHFQLDYYMAVDSLHEEIKKHEEKN